MGLNYSIFLINEFNNRYKLVLLAIMWLSGWWHYRSFISFWANHKRVVRT